MQRVVKFVASVSSPGVVLLDAASGVGKQWSSSGDTGSGRSRQRVEEGRCLGVVVVGEYSSGSAIQRSKSHPYQTTTAGAVAVVAAAAAATGSAV